MNVKAYTDTDVWFEDLYWSTPGYRDSDWDVAVATLIGEIRDTHLGQQLRWIYRKEGV